LFVVWPFVLKHWRADQGLGESAARVWNEGHKRKWSEVKEEAPVVAAPPLENILDAKNNTPKPLAINDGAPETPKPPLKKPKVPTPLKTEAQKVVDGCFTKAKILRARLDTVQSKYLTLKDAVDSDEAWDWAKSPSLQKPIATSRQIVEDFKKMNFWNSWFISSGTQFVTFAKKSFNPKQIENEFQHLPTLEKAINDFEKAVCRVLDMHRA
jgi:hypothetical protein